LINKCRVTNTESKYYADGEDAYGMKKDLKEKTKELEKPKEEKALTTSSVSAKKKITNKKRK
jgi:hypothetical protein